MGQRNEAAVFIGEAQRRDARTFCQLLQRDSKRKTELRHEPRLIRQTAVFELSGVFGLEPGNMVYTRINRVATPPGGAGMLSGPATTAAGLTFSSRTPAAQWISGR